jgi:outer membrane protein OmpA-like peptidoglycan-associated protein
MMRNACLLVVLVACSKPVAFKGDTALRIVGQPPAAPVAVDPPRVELRDNKIVIHEKVQFAFDKATILPASFGLLDEVAKVIQKNAHIKKIQVEGFASAEGDARHNLKLSDDRARSVMTYLTQHGIAKDLLAAKGFGIERPIADNSTESGREQNRRVEFNIIDQDVTVKRVEIDKQGKEKVIEEKHQPTGATSAR